VIFFVFLMKISTDTADFGPKIRFIESVEEWLHTARKIMLKTYKFGNNFHKKQDKIIIFHLFCISYKKFKYKTLIFVLIIVFPGC
jgi:hypothetical protein